MVAKNKHVPEKKPVAKRQVITAKKPAAKSVVKPVEKSVKKEEDEETRSLALPAHLRLQTAEGRERARIQSHKK